ncbi:MAG: myo-inositol-phosphate synthase [Pseudonocardiales bacterium]|jgi:myo-inositol-1-phosphate synthase|nr:myo-inositol-phosphate synthase [Pseudonocardiales bacterium]
MTATAAVSGLLLMSAGILPEAYGVTSSPLFPSLDLIEAKRWKVGGWDLPSKSPVECARHYDWFPAHAGAVRKAWDDVVVFVGHVGPLDWAFEAQSELVVSPPPDEVVSTLASNIESFRQTADVDHILVAYLGSPHRTVDLGLITENPALPASYYYGLAAVQTGCDFVDFTPSSALEFPSLIQAAEEAGQRVVGRDLSTGQTMMKAALHEMFLQRNMILSSWYSTNLIGNNDGRALTTAGFDAAKLADKLGAFGRNEPTIAHEVRIEFMEEWGDNKESWDAGRIATWHAAPPVDIRINWRGPDSFLAAPLVLDVARLMMYEAEAKTMAGLLGHLGYFFKRPFGMETTTLSSRWENLVNRYCLAS